jgi:hypothetical protein
MPLPINHAIPRQPEFDAHFTHRAAKRCPGTRPSLRDLSEKFQVIGYFILALRNY